MTHTDPVAIRARWAVMGLLIVIAGACARFVPVHGTTPVPLVEALPISVGIYYDEAFLNASHRAERHRERPWIVQFGKANAELFDDVFGIMFERSGRIEEMPAEGRRAAGLDAILEPRIEEYALLTPDDSGLNYFAASIKYRIYLHAPDGTLIESWPVTAYGKSPVRMFREKQALRKASMLAIRDAAASLALEFAGQQRVQAWLNDKGVTAHATRN